MMATGGLEEVLVKISIGLALRYVELRKKVVNWFVGDQERRGRLNRCTNGHEVREGVSDGMEEVVHGKAINGA